MKRRMFPWMVAAFIGIAASLAHAAAEFGDEFHYMKSDHPSQVRLNQLVGKPLPDVLSSPSQWLNGQVKPADLKGKVVLLDVWATWCGPCIRAIPHNNELAARYKKDGLVVLGVCSSRGQEEMNTTAQTHKIAYPTSNDPGNKIATDLKVGFFPTYIVVDRSGKVRAAGLRPDKIEPVITRLLKEPASTPAP